LYVHDVLEEGQTVAHIFKLRNNSSASVKILNIAVGCACTAATHDRDVIPPGETLDIPVTYRAKANMTFDSSQVIVETDSRKFRYIPLTVEGPIRVSIVSSPQSISFWGNESLKTPKEIKLYSPVNADFETEIIKVSSDRIHASLKKTGEGQKIIITFSSTVKTGSYVDNVSLKCTTASNPEKNIEIPVYSMVE
jgi:hypothetical protein